MTPADRPPAAARSRGKLSTTLGLTAAFLVVEVVGAVWTGSLALLADAGHMLADVGGSRSRSLPSGSAAPPPPPPRPTGTTPLRFLPHSSNPPGCSPPPGRALSRAYQR